MIVSDPLWIFLLNHVDSRVPHYGLTDDSKGPLWIFLLKQTDDSWVPYYQVTDDSKGPPMDFPFKT